MSTISAGTTVGTALVNTGDTTGNLVLQTNGTTTAVTIGTNQVVTLAQALPIGSGGTGQTTRQAAMDALAGAVTNGRYLRGDGTDVIMDTLRAGDMTGTLAVANGGTGQTTLTANHVLLGNGTSGIQAVDPGSSGNVLTSNGTTWTSAALPAGGVTSLNGQTGAITNTSLYAIGSYIAARPYNNTNYAANTTIAGSSLFSAGTSAYWSNGLGSQFWTDDAYQSTSYSVQGTSVNTGTWRCMSPATGVSNTGLMGIWVRIS